MLALTVGWALRASTAASVKNGKKLSLVPSRWAKSPLARSRSREMRVTSTSTTVVSWAETWSDSTIRRAIVLRSRVIFSVVPVLKNAGDLNIAGLARGIADVADRTRSNKIMPDDLAGGTFTITNTGSRGALFDTPIINQPQVAILGTGSVVRRPVVVIAEDGGETIAIRSMVFLALSYDHRIVDGADAARFLTTMKQRLEEGAFEADLGL